MRRRALRGGPRPRAADLPLQLLHLPPHAVLAGVARPEGFRLVAGEGELTKYTFGSHKNHHFFCKRCGVRAFGVGLPITYVDGRNA